MYGNMFEGLGTALLILFSTVFLLGCAIVGAVWFFYPKQELQLRSYNPIKPRIELVVNNNKLDTVFIYEQPVTTEQP